MIFTLIFNNNIIFCLIIKKYRFFFKFIFLNYYEIKQINETKLNRFLHKIIKVLFMFLDFKQFSNA